MINSWESAVSKKISNSFSGSQSISQLTIMHGRMYDLKITLLIKRLKPSFSFKTDILTMSKFVRFD